MNLSCSSQSVTAVCATLLSGSLIATHAAPVEDSPGVMAGPRDTVAIERMVRDEPRAQFAALTLDSADLSDAEAGKAACLCIQARRPARNDSAGALTRRRSSARQHLRANRET